MVLRSIFTGKCQYLSALLYNTNKTIQAHIRDFDHITLQAKQCNELE